MRHLLAFLGLLLLLLVAGGAGYLGFQSTQGTAVDAPPPTPVTVPVSKGEVQQTVTAPGQLVGTQEMLLGAKVSGQLTEVTVRPGSVVKEGEVLVRLDAASYATALTLARLQLAQAEAAYEQQLAEAALATQNSESRVGQARAQFPGLTAAEVRLQAAIEAEQRAENEYHKALDRPWEPPEVVESYRLEFVNAGRNREVAQAEYDAVLNQRWAVGQEVAALETDVARANLTAQFLQERGVDPLLKLVVDQAEADLAATVLRAPFDAVVLDIMVRPGQSVSVGTPLLLLADPTAVEVRTTVIEEDLPLTQIGQTAELFFDAQPTVAVQGHVARIVPQRVAGEDRPLYYVYIVLDDALPQTVYPGMTADAAIIVAEETEVLRLPRALVRANSAGQAQVKVWADGRQSESTVRVGLRGDVYIEIQEGLHEGDEVVGE